ncbi:MAG: sensor domain-containing diguanylate cyclase [Clostridiaceae bacterium]|nr:sensor domain-containing diguanylate cyclase [Clostridiaceae bacterium]
MKKIWEFYENMREIVYVSDLDTDEVIYLNRWGRDLLGYPTQESLAGVHCYELFHENSKPCAFCPNRTLKPGEFYEWKHYSQLLGKTLAIKDTVVEEDGHRYRMQISIDLGTQDQQQKTITDFATNEALVNEGLRLALSAPTPNDSMEVLIRYIGESLACDRIYIFEETPDHTYSNTYEWCRDGVVPQKDNLQDVPYETVKGWYQLFFKNQQVIIKDVEDIREIDPEAYSCLLPQKIHSLIASPLISNNQIIGFYGVDNPPGEFLNHISVMFQVLGHFIVSILRRRDLVSRLTTLSFCDQLTCAKNRHAMNAFISSVNPQDSIGILYCDVMGLKKVNDTEGHTAGDQLLIRAFQCLSSCFSKNSIFRIGGDEFLVLCVNMSEEEMEQRILALRKSMADYQLTMALGSIWQAHSNGQIMELMKEADQRMYIDKRNYYKQV